MIMNISKNIVICTYFNVSNLVQCHRGQGIRNLLLSTIMACSNPSGGVFSNCTILEDQLELGEVRNMALKQEFNICLTQELLESPCQYIIIFRVLYAMEFVIVCYYHYYY